MILASGHGHDALQGERETNILFEIPSKDSRSEPGQPPIGSGRQFCRYIAGTKRMHIGFGTATLAPVGTRRPVPTSTLNTLTVSER